VSSWQLLLFCRHREPLTDSSSARSAQGGLSVPWTAGSPPAPASPQQDWG
jgi:hypothetical protein